MKKIVILFLACACVSQGHAEKYDHSGTMEYQAGKVKNLIEGRTDLYYAGDYICTPGSEHYAPDCRKSTEWWVTEEESYTSVILDDGTTIIVTRGTDPLNVFSQLTVKWELPLLEKTETPTQTTFRYRLGKTKNGVQGIDIEGVGKGYYKFPDRAVHQDQ